MFAKHRTREANLIYDDYMRLLRHTVRFYVNILEETELKSILAVTMQLLNDMERIMQATIPYQQIIKKKWMDIRWF